MSQDLTKAAFKNTVFDFERFRDWSYSGAIPCVVDFWAAWCPPCKMIEPVFEELSREYEGKIAFYKVNTDEEPEIAAAFNVVSIPSLLFVPVHGQPRMSVGAMAKTAMKKLIDTELLSAQA